jgi:Uncharacterized conserved protein
MCDRLPIRMVSKIVVERMLELDWGTYPIYLAMSCLLIASISLPSKKMLPFGFSIRSMHLISVVLPERINLIKNKVLVMFAEYVQAAMERAHYEIIDDEEPFYSEVPEIKGVWATGKTLEACRKNLKSGIEGWIALRLRMGRAIPPIGGVTINVSAKPMLTAATPASTAIPRM